MAVNESSNTICTICYGHLQPPDEAIQAISICGHVFHDLCLKQWLDYCIKKTRIATCPVCNQKFNRENITRLYFQTTGMTGINEEEWRRLCNKVNKSPQESEDTEQLRKWKEEARKEMCLKNKALQEKELNQTLLEIRSQQGSCSSRIGLCHASTEPGELFTTPSPWDNRRCVTKYNSQKL
ncbi:RING-H2 finger protein ATL7-like [Papaver somniferum]|uniref:RING-H2 finger protein ATL7-like n=1 Tax=Papaver somniferum TaxID=3469 RepID=UPI000E6F6154|nr:RING-H2 finger protein ATL7-like [Papaver somniferum]